MRGISDAQADALAAVRSPYQPEHVGSVARRSALRPPRGLYELLRWHEAAVLAEVPSVLHKREVWHDHDAKGEGGSALGAHAWADEFRRYLEGSPFGLDADGFYERPVMAALAKMEGREGREAVTAWRIVNDQRQHLAIIAAPPSEGAVLAAFLRDVARNAFSYSEPADRWGFGVIAGVVTEAALSRLWRCYKDEAPARIIREAGLARV